MFGQLKGKKNHFLKKKKLFANFNDAKTRFYTFYERQMKIIIQI